MTAVEYYKIQGIDLKKYDKKVSSTVGSFFLDDLYFTKAEIDALQQKGNTPN